MRATQMIFGLARPCGGVQWGDLAPVMQTEAAHVWSLYERDVMRDAWVRTDALGAVYLLEATPEQAGPLLARQPIARHGLVEFELVPVGPFTPLSLLFGTQTRPVAPAAPPPIAGSTGRVLALDRLAAAATPEDLAPHLADEACHAWALWKGGVIRENYLRTDRLGGALVPEVPGISGARAVRDELPLVKAGLIEFECLALEAFMGFEALLEGLLDDAVLTLPDPTRLDPERNPQ